MKRSFLLIILLIALAICGFIFFLNKDAISQLTNQSAVINGEENVLTRITPLVLPDTVVNFPYTDDLEGESIIIKTDKKTYQDEKGRDVYTSITNTNGLEERAVLAFYFSKEKKDGVASIQQWKNNQWQELEFYDENIQISEEALGKALTKRATIPTDFKVKAATQIEIPQGETLYLRTKIAYPLGTSGEFWIEALGEKGSYGLLDPFYSSVVIRGGVTFRSNVAIKGLGIESFSSDGVWIVPAGVSSATIKAWGGGGGGGGYGDHGNRGGHGAGGGYTTAVIAVTPGESLTILVGGGGGLGAGSNDCGAGGGGGGYSGVLRSSTVLLQAAGGGGGGGTGSSGSSTGGAGGGGGGVNGVDGGVGSDVEDGGNGAVTATGGSGGTGTAGNDGTAGTTNQGGTGGDGDGITTAGGAGGTNGGGNGGRIDTGNACPGGGGGGGGGYAGGGGGEGGSSSSGGTGGGGGGSSCYTIDNGATCEPANGTTIKYTAGSGQTAGEETDVYYLSPTGKGGNRGDNGVSAVSGNSGRIVITY